MATSLAHDLLSGIYRAGDVLPKEMELTAQFGVSRASVRSGLQLLNSCGMVRRYSGQGTIVQEFRDWNILDPVFTGWLAEHEAPHPELLRDFFAFRYGAEPLIAAIAAINAGARDLLAMEEAFEGMVRSVDAEPSWDRRAFSEFDVDFHAAIYRGTRNAIWAQLAHILRPAIRLVVTKSNQTADLLQDSLGRHRRLMEAIRLRDAKGAFEAAIRVMDRTAQDLRIETRSEGLTDAADPFLILTRRLAVMNTVAAANRSDQETETTLSIPTEDSTP
ncbi:FadR/GntR family transcriptional regulator [Consotaella salsifontis]|uniref:FadR/GntR family transcriptional regulator n=1 Tax=Consotaella salsifontis TaxID=1365950 RepID=UPI00099902A8|nr:FCD domain-containing protein [Consotaella salsifontis]